MGAKCGIFAMSGSVAEWLKALVSKTNVRETVPRVQISPLPHLYGFIFNQTFIIYNNQLFVVGYICGKISWR